MEDSDWEACGGSGGSERARSGDRIRLTVVPPRRSPRVHAVGAGARLLTGPYRASVLADSTELAEFRRGFGAWLEGADIRSRAVSELLLAAHEAVAHAIRRSAPAGFIGVRGVLAEGEVTIDVTSKGDWGEPGHRAEEQEHALTLIRGLVDQLLISSDGSGTRLKMRRSLAQTTLRPVLEPA